MSNFEEKFRNWQEKMNRKTDTERHVYAMSVALFSAAVVSFFVISNWYFVISGNEVKSSIFTDLENIFYEQRDAFVKSKDALVSQGKDIVEVLKLDNSTSTATTSDQFEVSTSTE